MDLGEFDRIFDEYDRDRVLLAQAGIEDEGLIINYVNQQGKQSRFRLVNIKYSSEYGDRYIEGDCYSDYRSDVNASVGIYDNSAAITSHRTFKIENIISID